MRTKRHGVPNLGERISRLMETANLNASELSARTSISVSYLTRIIRGEVVNPTIDFVSRIASGLGVTETELIREDVEELAQIDVEDDEAVKPKQQAVSTPQPTAARAAIAPASLSHRTTGEVVDAQIAAARLSEDVEKHVHTMVSEYTERLLALIELIEMQTKEVKEGKVQL
jgi:transcriptional regulator with XRE-family HTH domain